MGDIHEKNCVRFLKKIHCFWKKQEFLHVF